ncbi:protein TONSOKU isoform X1 [Amaranthus tricolor]|uniref:protein TONSOKU isoform X1 n=1 Tax=Amaranthus tricolor TaxID=29722 RepID=UPI00258915E0|nr:protein TONSOKU isoform X1 [Amaranthus tricolor]
MGKNDVELAAAKKAYKSANDIGNRKEEARWANVIGDILKEKGEYCKAIKWLRIDYQISSDYLVEKDRLPACQSIGELYLRIQDYENALYYQKEHLQLAKDADNLIEQQRASTQLGRTYHEVFSKYEDHSALHKAKKYFKSAMDLARTLKENPPDSKSSFLKEYVDAYNNIGLLEMDLDNLKEAEKILTQGLKICDDEEVNENDAGRTRLHHNLGFVYTQLRMWDKAREHIQKDILICKNIGHCQGEAKGYINLGELYNKIQKFDRALSSYRKALELTNSLEDEYALARQIEENMRVVKEYVKVMDEIKIEAQNLKKLRRSMTTTKGTSGERKCLRQQLKSIDNLIEKTIIVSDWSKHLEFAKMKKKIAKELCDKEKLADSLLVVGESYQKLRDFRKASKWYTKSSEIYKVINNLEGQAIVKINMGDILDSKGDWKAALDAFKEGYNLAVEANKVSLQISALENMHYSQMMRFDNAEEVRKLELQIQNLKSLISNELEPNVALRDSCSETESEGNDSLVESRFANCESSRSSESLLAEKPLSRIEHIVVDEASSPPLRRKKLQKLETDSEKTAKRFSRITEATPKKFSDSQGSPLTVGRKRTRLVLSDDEEDSQCQNRRLDSTRSEEIATSNELKTTSIHQDPACDLQDFVPDGYKQCTSSCSLVNVEESSCSHKSCHGNAKINDNKPCFFQCGIIIKVEDVLVSIEAESNVLAGKLDIESLKVHAACSYYLQLPSQKRCIGLLPIIDQLKIGEHIMSTNNAVETVLNGAPAGELIEASVSGWVQKRLINLYVDCCEKLSERPNMKLLIKLYNLEISEDEVIVSDCELQDMSIVPLLDALRTQKTISMLNLSHNMLGNATMERLKQALTSLGQKYGALVLDLHCNLFGPTALFQICECPVLISRLEVLNISGNRLTDACGAYLSTILRNCKGLYNLNIERCSITSRTIQTVADALDSDSVLSHLSVGHNNPISGASLANLLKKLAKLERFSELSLDGLKLNKHAIDSVCQLAKSSCLSSLMLGATNIGSDGALKLTESLFLETQELAKLNLSYCGLRPMYFERLKTFPGLLNIVEINFSGNPITSEGGNALASLLANPDCCVKVLQLSKCRLSLDGVIQIIKSLSENESLEELNLACNIDQTTYQLTKNDLTGKLSPKTLNSENKLNDPTTEQHEEDALNQLEAADSYDNNSRFEGSESRLDDTCNSQGQRSVLQPDDLYVKELSSAISNAKTLQFLDLSDNGFSTEVADTFYSAWCSCTRICVARKHFNGQLLHLSTQNKICCVKPCCRKNW